MGFYGGLMAIKIAIFPNIGQWKWSVSLESWLLASRLNSSSSAMNAYPLVMNVAWLLKIANDSLIYLLTP